MFVSQFDGSATFSSGGFLPSQATQSANSSFSSSKEITGADSEMDIIEVGSIACDSVKTTILCDNKQQGRAVNNANKRSKEKHLNVIKEMQVNPIESSRLSISSTASTTLSSEYDWTTKPEQSPFAETVGRERDYWEYRANKPHSSPNQPSSPGKISHYFHKKHTIKETVQTCASPIKTTLREVVSHNLKHMNY